MIAAVRSLPVPSGTGAHFPERREDFVNRFLPIALVAVLGAIVGAGAQAQNQNQTQATAPAWRSAFESYQPFSDQKTMPWRQANDTVQGVGGWRAYAREAAQPASAAASGAKPDGPAGHRAHPMH